MTFWSWVTEVSQHDLLSGWKGYLKCWTSYNSFGKFGRLHVCARHFKIWALFFFPQWLEALLIPLPHSCVTRYNEIRFLMSFCCMYFLMFNEKLIYKGFSVLPSRVFIFAKLVRVSNTLSSWSLTFDWNQPKGFKSSVGKERKGMHARILGMAA